VNNRRLEAVPFTAEPDEKLPLAIYRLFAGEIDPRYLN